MVQAIKEYLDQEDEKCLLDKEMALRFQTSTEGRAELGLVMNLYRGQWPSAYGKGFELWLNFWLWRGGSQWRNALHFFHWMYVLRWVLWGSHRMEHPGTWWQPALQIFVLELLPHFSPLLLFSGVTSPSKVLLHKVKWSKEKSPPKYGTE